MYDDNCVDVAHHNSKMDRFAQKALNADVQPHLHCLNCRCLEERNGLLEMLEPHYSRDKDHVFIYARMIPEADVKTFEILDYSYSREINHGYLEGSVVEGEDPATFSIDNS